MGGKLKHFRASCTILLLMLLLQSAVAKKKSKDDDRNKLLAEYEAFEKQVHETVTSMLSKLTEEETCEKGDPSCDPSAAQLPKELEPALESLLAWLKNMDDILKTLIPGRFHTHRSRRWTWIKMRNACIGILILFCPAPCFSCDEIDSPTRPD